MSVIIIQRRAFFLVAHLDLSHKKCFVEVIYLFSGKLFPALVFIVL